MLDIQEQNSYLRVLRFLEVGGNRHSNDWCTREEGESAPEAEVQQEAANEEMPGFHALDTDLEAIPADLRPSNLTEREEQWRLVQTRPAPGKFGFTRPIPYQAINGPSIPP